MEIDPVLFPDPANEFDVPIVYRQYLCPNCGVLLENELVGATNRRYGTSVWSEY